MTGDVVTLGLGGQNHDFSAALAVDGEIVVAISEERLTRQKYSVDVDLMSRDFDSMEDLARQSTSWTEHLRTQGLLSASIDYVLDSAGVALPDVAIVSYCCNRQLLPPSLVASRLWRVNHHMAHAASSYLASPFGDAVVIVADGAGDRITGTAQLESVTVLHGRQQSLKVLWRLGDPHSIGGLSEAATYLIGYRLLEEGKTMALASFGSDRFCDAVRSLVTYHDDGRFGIGDEPVEPRRIPDRISKVKLLRSVCGLGDTLSEADRIDLARAVQVVIEETLLHTVTAAARQTGSRNLCLAGGVALNSVANFRLLQTGLFDDMFVQPHAGDGGLAVGGALLAAERVAPGRVPRVPVTHAYLGRSYTDEQALSAVDDAGPHVRCRRMQDVAMETARLLADGKVIAWFQGGSEWGPRALGNRSILADPRRREMKRRLDEDVKRREPFRPYAPAVLAEHAGAFFLIDRPSPFMLLVAPVRPELTDRIPAVVHVDGTARLQTVHDATNPAFAALLRDFDALTGVPVLLNTSFNVNKEPIVETPADAVRTFLDSEIDALVLGPYLVERAEAVVA